MTTTDKLEIDHLTKTFFDLFTNAGQQQPDWTIIDRTCIPETVIIKQAGIASVVYNLESFVAPRKQLLADGTLTGFHEWEIAEETTIIGHIAQRFSRYQKTGCLSGRYFKTVGSKLFQFIKTDNGWKINSLVWEDDET